MNDDMPALVEAWPNAPPPSAGGGPWGGGGWGGNSEVAPGGFGGGTPALQFRRMPGTPHPGNHYAATPAPAPAPPPDNPWLQAPLAPPGADPFSMPAAAFDNPGAMGGSPGFTPWAPGPMHTMSPGTPGGQGWYTPRTPKGDVEKGFGGFEDEGWPQFNTWPENGAFWGQSPGGSPAPGLSPSPSTSSALAVGPRAQYKRPDEWRPGFTTPRPGTLSRLLSIGKGSGDTFRSLLGKPTLHWTLDASRSSCQWDVRRPPDEAFRVTAEHRPLGFLERQEGALNPPPLRMRITHPLLPWTIFVAAGPSEVVTVGHLLHTIHAELSHQVYHRDFWNDAMTEEYRKHIYEAWETRCGGNRTVAEQGIRRMDFLGDQYIFAGLRRIGDGEWQMKLKSGRRVR